MATVDQVLSQAWAVHQAGDFNAAQQLYRKVLDGHPENANAWCYLGLALHDQGRFAQAIEAYRRAIGIKPDYPIAYNNMGNSLQRLGEFGRSLASYREALRLKPDYANAYKNMGTLQFWQGFFDQAAEAFGKAIELNPANAESHKSLGIILLLQGQFERGWPEYAWRWKTKDLKRPDYAQPRWDGSSLAGRTILLHAEQGLGDAIHFVRYAAVLKQQAGRVIVQCHKALVPLLRTCRGIDQLITFNSKPPDFDVYASLLDVPAILKMDLSSVVAGVPYLSADESLIEYWARELHSCPGFKIGIVWQGSPQHKADQRRSIPLEQFAPLADTAGVRLISLQKGPGSEQIPAFAARHALLDLGPRLDESTGAFMDSAAVLKNLDLLITADTAMAHLGGALGVRTWLALAQVPDWRWLLGRDDSPWYPTMRLFRQKSAGDWPGLFQEIVEQLKSELADRTEGQAADSTPHIPLSGFNELVRSRHGMMLYNKNDRYIGRSLKAYGEFSEGETALLRQIVKPGHVVVEAGANIGAHTIPLARFAGERGRVIAFEPQRVVFQTLCANVALNGLSNVECHHAGLGDGVGTVTVPALDYRQENNFGGLELGGHQHGEATPLVTVDSLNLPRCNLIKLDVEGMELQALQGARRTIQQHQPVLYVENDRDKHSAALIELIQSFGYDLYWHTPPLFNPRNHLQNPKDIFGGVVSVNMLCLPKSANASVAGLRPITSLDSNWRRGPPSEP